MLTILNQSGESIIAVGGFGSPIRCFEQYNITVPKLIDKIKDGFSDIQLASILNEEGIPSTEWSDIIRSAHFYAQI